jgi:hypothetical protein
MLEFGERGENMMNSTLIRASRPMEMGKRALLEVLCFWSQILGIEEVVGSLLETTLGVRMLVISMFFGSLIRTKNGSSRRLTKQYSYILEPGLKGGC